MEYSINIKDILNIAKRNVKVIILFALVFALLAGAYVVLKNRNNAPSEEELQKTQGESATYTEYGEKMPMVKDDLQKKLVKEYEVINSNPIMKMDPMKVKYIKLTYTLPNSTQASRADTFGAWIDGMDCKELFGTDKPIVKEYRQEYVNTFGNPGEVVVSIIASKYYNYKAVSKKIDRYLKKKAKASGVNIVNSERTNVSGFSQRIVDRQDVISNNAAKMTNYLTVLNNYKMEAPEVVNGNSGKDLLKKGIIVIAGLIFGALLGIVVVSFNVIRKGIVLSSEQIEDFFGIERIAQGSSKDEKYPKVIDAVVNALSEDNSDVLVVSSEMNDEYEKLTAEINKKSDRGYTYSEIKDDDVDFLNGLSEIGGVIAPVEIGKTTQKEVQDIIRWTQKFKKNMIGYIVLDS